MAQRRFVLLELEADDPGQPIKTGGTVLPLERWIWGDFFQSHDVVVHNAWVFNEELGEKYEGFPNFDAYMKWKKNGR